MMKQTPLSLVHKLCQALATERIVYCHWKSNAALDRSASGDNDLDLLVSRADAQAFTKILYCLGFKQAQVPPERQMPGVLDYYGYDGEAGKLVHVHAHYQLILGDDMTKNYRLPIEEPFLASAVQGTLFQVPAPEFELVVFVIRMVLKHSTWDAILSGQGTWPASERRELEYLQPQVDWTKVHDILQQHLPYLDAALFDQCLRSLRPDCSLSTRIGVAQQLQSSLKAHTRRSGTPNTLLKMWRRAVGGIRRYILRQSGRKHMTSGGVIIALIGGDGAGKSTAVDGLYDWLSRDFTTTKAHLGKPPWSWSTFVVRGTLKVSVWLNTFLKGKRPAQVGPGTSSSVFPGYLELMRRVCVANDRYRAYLRARRFATNGGFVICDRYPLSLVKLMDGPKSDQMTYIGQTNWLIKFLMQAEKKYYQHIVPPEMLVVLRVPPETAVQRRTEQEAAFVRARCQEIWELDWRQTCAHVVDAERPIAEVLSELRSFVWSKL